MENGYLQDGETGQSPYFALDGRGRLASEIYMTAQQPQHKTGYTEDVNPVEDNEISYRHEKTCLPYSTLFICNAIWTSVLFGYSLGVLNSCINSIALHFQWCGNGWDASCTASQFYQSVINAILFLGAVIGALTSGRLVSLGRRFALQLACWIFIAGGLLGASASGPQAWMQLVVARILVGIGLGVVTVATPLYISEMTPPQTRGFFGTMHQTLIGVGIFVGISLGLPLSPNSLNDSSYIMTDFDHWWWRFMLGFQCLPSMFCLIGFSFFCREETPHYLVDSERTIEAAQTIMKIYGVDDVIHVEGTLLEITQAVHEARGLTQITLREALKEDYYRFGLLLGFFLAAIQQLSGINVIISSSDSLFSMAGLTPSTVTMASTIMAASNAISSAVASLFVENWGRRPLLLWGLAGQVLFMGPPGILRYLNETHASWLPSMLVLSSYQSTWLSVISTIGFVTAFSVALGPIVWIYLSEIYPVEIRGSALGACGAVNWITAFCVVFFGRFLHVTAAFNCFGVICFFGWVLAYYWVVETRGSSIEDSPVSPQSMRMASRLIQESRHNVQEVTLNDIREKMRSEASFPSNASRPWLRSGESYGARAADEIILDTQIQISDGEMGSIESLGVDPCLLDDDSVEMLDVDEVETTRINSSKSKTSRRR